MALQTESAIVRGTGLNAGNSKAPADAFLNVLVIDKAGNEIRLQGGIPLYADKALHKAIMDKIAAGGELNVKIDVNMVDHNKSYDL